MDWLRDCFSKVVIWIRQLGAGVDPGDTAVHDIPNNKGKSNPLPGGGGRATHDPIQSCK